MSNAQAIPLDNIRGNWIITLQGSGERQARWRLLREKLLTEPTSDEETLKNIGRYKLADGLVEFLEEDEAKFGGLKLSSEIPFQSRLRVIHFLLVSAVTAQEQSLLFRLFNEGMLDGLLLELASVRNLHGINTLLHNALIAMLTEMISVPAGRYAVGANAGDRAAWNNEKPRHYLRLSGFKMSRFPLTYGVYTRAIKKITSDDPPAALPVDQISWEQAIQFCNSYSANMGFPSAYELKLQTDGTAINWREGSIGFRLPTEAEWEAAARANTRYLYAGSDIASDVGWGFEESSGRKMPVGLKQKNEWGLYDMTGNIWEWCWDGYELGAYENRVDAAQKGLMIEGRDPLKNPKGHVLSSYAIARGGSAGTARFDLRNSYRGRFNPEKRIALVGMRFVQSHHE